MRLVLSAALDILPLALLFYIFVPAAIYPSLFNHAGTNREVCAATQLCTSWSTPWGIVTSNFLFDGLGANLDAMVYHTVFAAMSIFTLPQAVRRRVSARVALTAFLSGVLANLAWLILAEIEYIRGGVGSTQRHTATQLWATGLQARPQCSSSSSSYATPRRGVGHTRVYT